MRSARRALATLSLVLLARTTMASPLEFVSPRDPLVPELRVLELYDLPPDSGRFRLPHLNTLPLQRLELMGRGPAILAGTRVRTLVAERIERELQRDALAMFADARARQATPRLWQREWSDDERAELSVGAEGAWDATRTGGVHDTEWRDGSGVHARAGVQVDRWLAFLHLTLGKLHNAARFTDVLISNSDLAAQTDEAYIAYTAGTRWSVAIGRQHFAWGPGEAGSLLLSGTAAPLTALTFHARLEPLRADGFALHATTDPGRGEQLAAHRLEWQPAGGVRVGIGEAARYRSDGWQGVYLASVIPFSIAQRLQQQDGDSAAAARNNVEVALDASWRPADGTRFYGELLLDDIHAKTGKVPNKYGWQLGADGAWTHGFTRLTWNAEYTWLSRFVYTSFFGESFTAQNQPLGFPTGPDARRLRTRLSWDPAVAWQFTGIATRTWKGENDFNEPFVPGSPVPNVATLEGTAEVTDDLTGIARWWPASGIDVSVAAGYARIHDAGHVAGARRNVERATLAFRLIR